MEADALLKISAADLLRSVRFETLAHLANDQAPIDAWVDAFGDIVATVAGQLRPRFRGSNSGRIDSAARSALRTILERVRDGSIRDQKGSIGETLALNPRSLDSLLGMLILIAFDKIYEKKRREAVDLDSIASSAEREVVEQQRLVDVAIRDEMARQLEVMFARLRFLDNNKDSEQAQVHLLLLLKRLGVEDLSFEQIAQSAGVTNYSVGKTRETIDKYWPDLEKAGQKAIENLARRLRREE